MRFAPKKRGKHIRLRSKHARILPAFYLLSARNLPAFCPYLARNLPTKVSAKHICLTPQKRPFWVAKAPMLLERAALMFVVDVTIRSDDGPTFGVVVQCSFAR